MEEVKDMLSEGGKKCWRCGFKIVNGSICPMCGAVNKLAVHESIPKESLDGDSEDDDKPKRFLNTKHANDNEGEAFSQSDGMNCSTAGHVEGKTEEKRVDISSTEAQSHLPASMTLPESHNGALRGDRSVDLQQQLAMGPDHNCRGAAAVTTLQEKVNWIK